jgi:multiple sugar transport system permease protein
LEHWIGLTNLRIGSFEIFFRNSLFVAITVTFLTLLTSSMAGYVFAKYNFRGRDALFVIILSMLMIPFNISIIPLYALMLDLEWTNSYWALIIPSAFSPFGIFLMRQFMHSIPDELLDAARIDGASEFGIFFRIVMPLSTAALAALAIFTFIAQWDDFLWPLVILDVPALYTLPLGLAQFRGRVGTNVGGLAAASMLAVIPVLIVYFIAQRRFIEGIAMTGMKG